MMKVLTPLLGAALVLGARSAAAQPSGAAGGVVVRTRLGAVRGETVTEAGATARIFRGID